MTLTLVIDTATAACSVALIADGAVIAEAHDEVGRGHAERLMPMIAALPGGGRADAVLVDCGPGSFTGIRVGIAAARALGLGWEVPVHGFSSTALLAAAAGSDAAEETIGIAMVGGHGELFVQRYANRPLAALTKLDSLAPDAAARAVPDPLVIGSGADQLVAMRGSGVAEHRLPRAAEARFLPSPFVTLPPEPIYGRDADAKATPEPAR